MLRFYVEISIVLHRDFKAADKYLADLKKTGQRDLYKSMKHSVATYSTNEKYLMTKKQFATVMGQNLRDRRESLKQTPGEAGDMQGYSEAQLNAIERGESPDLSVYKLFQLTNNYGMTIEQALNGIKEKSFSSDQEAAIEALNVSISELDADLIYALANQANAWSKAKQKIKKQKYLPADED
ncbi:MAG: helix-turn-helix domain-containing protein [Defluviitaleaceae bacterium]|nr:helix-turn-helix domain-containing protein [Defluviitaleaceae bacterium]